jgi:predicted alpha/beta hydrolase family esterase
MTNAWIQRFLTIANVLAFWGWAMHLWPEHRGWAVLALFAPVLITPVVLLQSFSMAWWVNRQDNVPSATLTHWLRAWWAETMASLKIVHFWQPFRHQAIPDHLPQTPGRRGMVLVHGFFCNRAFWTDWMKRLQTEGRAFVSVDLEPAYGSINEYAAIVERAIAQVERATGVPPVVVGHSMGGLAIRAWAAAYSAQGGQMNRVARIFTLGTPHHGTGIARLSFTTNGVQMRQASTWQTSNLEQLPENFSTQVTCFYSNCDNIVFPSTTACLAGADNQLVLGKGHVELAFFQGIQNRCWQALDASEQTHEQE